MFCAFCHFQGWREKNRKRRRGNIQKIVAVRTHDVKAEEEATARRRRKRRRRTRPEDGKADVASEQVPLEKKSVNNSIRKCQKNSSSSSSR